MKEKIVVLLAVTMLIFSGCTFLKQPYQPDMPNTDLANLIEISKEEFLQKYPYFENKEDNIVELSGEHEIEETVIIPKNLKLTIKEGTHLKFNKDISIISYSPIEAIGTTEEPITLEGNNNQIWGTLALINSKGTFHHINFKDGNRAHVNNIEFYATLSLIESESEVLHSTFTNLHGKDGLWANKGTATIRNNNFDNHNIDCIDFDGAAGEISDNLFRDCADEAVDLSEDINVEVFQNTFYHKASNVIEADHDLEKYGNNLFMLS